MKRRSWKALAFSQNYSLERSKRHGIFRDVLPIIIQPRPSLLQENWGATKAIILSTGGNALRASQCADMKIEGRQSRSQVARSATDRSVAGQVMVFAARTASSIEILQVRPRLEKAQFGIPADEDRQIPLLWQGVLRADLGGRQDIAE